MKITKFVHSCLLVEMPEPVNRTALFDPGVMSEEALDVEKLEFLDDIFITHEHSDHFSMDLLQKLVARFPHVRITTTRSVAAKLKEVGITSTTDESDGVKFFDSPHEGVAPMMNPPEQIGIHYLDMLSDPGDSHSFTETKKILALPVTAPWGSTDTAVKLAIDLKPLHIVPIHDWHWKDEVREDMYGRLQGLFTDAGITFHEMITGEPIVIKL